MIDERVVVPLARGIEVVENRTTERVWRSMTLRCRACGAEVTFLRPDEERQGWYRESHRCGGRTWQG